MSIPENTSATPEVKQETSKETPSIEEQLATANKRFLDTQASYTKGQQALKALEAEKNELMKLIADQNKVVIPKEDQERLDKLMYEDPVSWRAEMDSIESKARGEFRANVAELTGKAKEAADAQFELSRRQQVLKEFNDSSELQITEELIANEVPPRITKKLAEGKISFDDFLQEVATYVGKGKVVQNEETLGQPNMGNLGGKNLPANLKPQKSAAEQYKNTIY